MTASHHLDVAPPCLIASPSTLVNLEGIRHGDALSARRFLANGHHPLDVWAPIGTNAWTLSLLATPGGTNDPMVDGREDDCAWPVIRSNVAHRLRHAGPDGKRTVLLWWAEGRWGWRSLLNATDSGAEQRLIVALDTVQHWLLSATGDFPLHERPPWSHAQGPGYSYALAAHERGFAMDHALVRAMLHELLHVGNAGAWAVPPLARYWKDRAWWRLPLHDEAYGKPAATLLIRAQERGQARLVTALQKLDAMPVEPPSRFPFPPRCEDRGAGTRLGSMSTWYNQPLRRFWSVYG